MHRTSQTALYYQKNIQKNRVGAFKGGTDAKVGVEVKLEERVVISGGGEIVGKEEVVGEEVAGEVAGEEVAGGEVEGKVEEVEGMEGCTVEMLGSSVGLASTEGRVEAAD
ncbi:hypothetical protein BDR04DRAFT_1121979 [Suillus decipiens]|nr:hypothetical protein BDR04DRAFT_1121979 [Suillus decipiens]